VTAVVHRSSRTLPALLAALAAVMLLMALDAFHRGAFITACLGVVIAVGVAIVAWRTPWVQVDDAGVRETSPRGVRSLKWDEITRVAGEKKSGKGVMRLYRDEESWELNFLAFPKPEQVVSFVTTRLPRTAKVPGTTPTE